MNDWIIVNVSNEHSNEPNHSNDSSDPNESCFVCTTP